MSDFEDFPVSFQLVDTEVITTRLAEAESKELPSYHASIQPIEWPTPANECERNEIHNCCIAVT